MTNPHDDPEDDISQWERVTIAFPPWLVEYIKQAQKKPTTSIFHEVGKAVVEAVQRGMTTARLDIAELPTPCPKCGSSDNRLIHNPDDEHLFRRQCRQCYFRWDSRYPTGYPSQSNSPQSGQGDG